MTAKSSHLQAVSRDDSSKEGDRELVAKAQKGDREAYRELVERYQQRAFSIAFEIVRRHEDAEDIVQEAFVKAYLKLKDFHGKSSFYTWLYRIVCNMAIDVQRKRTRRGGDALEFDEKILNSEQLDTSYLGGSKESPQDAFLRKEKGSQIEQALQGLTEEHRAVIVLREIEGLGYDRIAEIVGVSKGTVMSRLHYARKKLQQALRDLA